MQASKVEIRTSKLQPKNKHKTTSPKSLENDLIEKQEIDQKHVCSCFELKKWIKCISNKT